MKELQTLKSLSKKGRLRIYLACLLAVLVFPSVSLTAQTRVARDSAKREPLPSAIPACPDGQKYWMGMSTTGLVTEEGCYSLAEYERVSTMFFKSLCGETSSAFGTWDQQGHSSGHSENHEWKNGKCHVTFKVWKNGKERTTKSRETYYRWTCANVYTYEGDKQVRVYPKPEWKECKKQ